jgi:uracil-DNA glycosylase family 4
MSIMQSLGHPKAMNKGDYLGQMEAIWSQCRACPRLAERKKPVFGFGNPDAGVVIVGEAPGATEEKEGLPFVGPSGRLLDLILGECSARPEVIEIVEKLHETRRFRPEEEKELREALRAWLYQDYFFTNTIMCRPPENADPIPKEIHNCSTRLLETIYTIDPVLIIAVGRIAAEALLQSKSVNISRVRGNLHEVAFQGRLIEFTYPVIPVLHTSYLLRKNDFNSEDGDAKKTFNDILRAIHIYDELMLRHYGIPKPQRRPVLGGK